MFVMVCLFFPSFPPGETLASNAKIKLPLRENQDMSYITLLHKQFQRALEKNKIIEDFAPILSCNKRFIYSIC